MPGRRRIDSTPCPRTPHAPRRRRRARCPACCPSSAPTAAAVALALRLPGAGGGQHAGLPGGAEGADRPGPGRRRPRRARDGAARALPGAVRRGARRWALFSAARFYMVSWLGERITADLRNAVYAHVRAAEPRVLRDHARPARCSSRLTTDTTLVQTVVGSSLSMGLRNAVMGIGALVALVVTNPWVMTQVLGILVLVVLPSLYFGRRVRKLSRAPARTAWPTPAPSPPRC
ncbi:MAG: ABC transporter transmembrane domain-containing protein [Comamonadaceae bacterium]|nr:ABC transporter transmembrane domain-containing protein [Comamonadaceae bacterium]